MAAKKVTKRTNPYDLHKEILRMFIEDQPALQQWMQRELTNDEIPKFAASAASMYEEALANLAFGLCKPRKPISKG